MLRSLGLPPSLRHGVVAAGNARSGPLRARDSFSELPLAAVVVD